MPDDRSVAESTSTWGVVNVDSGEAGDPTEDLRAPSSKLPWAICKSLLPNYTSFII
jgi:1-phosphatidylinositol-3-phosphate 5-kinase